MRGQQQTGDTILLGKLKISFTKLFHAKDVAAIANAEIIYNAANNLTPAQRTTAGISDGEMTGYRDAIDTFKNLPTPAQMKAVRKQLTELLPQLFKKGNDILTDSLDGLMHQFKDTNPDFYNEYLNVRPLFESHRHTTLIVTAVDEEGKDLQNVQVLITSDKNNFEDITDAQSTAKQQISPEVDYKVKFVLPEYEDQEIDKINLNAGEHEKVVVKMKKK